MSKPRESRTPPRLPAATEEQAPKGTPGRAAASVPSRRAGSDLHDRIEIWLNEGGGGDEVG